MKKFLICFVGLFLSSFAFGQFVSSERITKITSYHSTVGTTTADAIATASIGTNVLGFSICNDAENTSTHLLVGQAADVSTDGTMLGKGQCYECLNCTSALLDALKVEAQAASNGYSIIVYRK
jgi:hypothetical protein